MRGADASRLTWALPGLALAGVLAAACSFAPSSPTTEAPIVIPLPTTLPPNLSHEDAMRLFEYDRALLAEVSDNGTTEDGGAFFHDIRYVTAAGTTARAILVLPPGDGPFAAVVFFPGGMQGGNEFQPDAIDLAGRGIASLLIDYPELYSVPTAGEQAVTNMIFETRELRKLVDWLASRPEIDPNRLGLYGVSYGAVRAGMFAGVEGQRLKVAVLNSTPSTYGVPDMAPFDPITWAPYVSPCALYLQEGTQDTWFTREDAEAYIAAAREPKRLVWYEAGHGLNDQAYADQVTWFVEALRP
jgi:dienelactone hydrolase